MSVLKGSQIMGILLFFHNLTAFIQQGIFGNLFVKG